MFDLKPVDQILLGRVITAVGDEVIEDGFVEVIGGKITRVGPRATMGTPAAGLAVTDTGGKTIMPGLIQSHGHLSWDGVHELSFQSMYDSPEIRAYKAAGNMLKSLRAGVTL
eukprot:gene6597-8763_t